MANIKINDLQPAEFEFSELSYSELEFIVGGKNIFSRLWDAIKSIGRGVDRTVRHNVPGGWLGLIRSIFN